MLWKQYYFCYFQRSHGGPSVLASGVSLGDNYPLLRAADNQMVLQSQKTFMSSFILIASVL